VLNDHIFRVEPSYKKVINVVEGKALHFQKMCKLLKAAIEVAHWLEVVEGLKPSEASLTGR